MTEKTLYRKRFIPMETIALKDDQILLAQEDLIVTRWKTLKPRNDVGSGLSAYHLRDGLKVSKLFDPAGRFIHWYCDMIQPVIREDAIIFEDLLLDVVILPDGSTRILDADEAADAARQGLISTEQLCQALTSLHLLLTSIYDGKFEQYSGILSSFEPLHPSA